MNPSQHAESETTKAGESRLSRLWRYLVDRPLV
jgi:hypothetical protein